MATKRESKANSDELARDVDAIGRLAGGIAHDFNNLLSVILSYTELLVGDLHEHDPMRADLVEVNKAGRRAAELTRHLIAFTRQGGGDSGAALTPAATPSVTGQHRGSETILVVEEDEQVRVLARRLLRRAEYQVLEAINAPEALLICNQLSRAIHLVISDVVLFGPSGRELVEKLAAIRPGTKVLFMSGYTDDALVHHGVLDQGVAFLPKPITPDGLLEKVREVLGPAPRTPALHEVSGVERGE